MDILTISGDIIVQIITDMVMNGNHKETCSLAVWSALATINVGLGTLSQASQSSAELRSDIAATLGYQWMKFVNNQGADLAAGLVVPTAFIAVSLAVDKLTKSNRDHDYLATVAAKTGMVVGSCLALVEAIEMTGFLVDDCELAMGSCRGDLGDILTFSVPIIAGWLYLMENRHKNSKNNT